MEGMKLALQAWTAASEKQKSSSDEAANHKRRDQPSQRSAIIAGRRTRGGGGLARRNSGECGLGSRVGGRRNDEHGSHAGSLAGCSGRLRSFVGAWPFRRKFFWKRTLGAANFIHSHGLAGLAALVKTLRWNVPLPKAKHVGSSGTRAAGGAT